MLSPFAALVLSLVVPPPASPPQVLFQGRCVTVTAEGAPLRALLTEWARAGQFKLSGLEQVADRPVTLHVSCADERLTLEALLEGTDPLLVPRQAALAGASSFVGVAILGRDPSLPRRAPLPNAVPEVVYPDPMPGRDWSSVQPDADAPPPISLQRVPEAAQAPATVEPPEMRFEYHRPASGLAGLPAGDDVIRTPEDRRALTDAVRGGAVPESLFEYPIPAAAPPESPDPRRPERH